MFGKMGATELVLILGIALVVFGPGKLPEIGKAFGKAIGEFKNHANKISEDVKVDLDSNKEDKE
ncbi:twin-arginine translocase TatA/TatE family subunit [Tissierella praeacuta]|uniref:twin-arginine translocase TatA/TatE family subunit n=1 Tax=Tissierella praeacuta TaxID=43131 RepID=UPI0028B02B3B|nr:twin-arginine translocase TatA/TatE family subunit [Tissierella praeacuta]